MTNCILCVFPSKFRFSYISTVECRIDSNDLAANFGLKQAMEFPSTLTQAAAAAAAAAAVQVATNTSEFFSQLQKQAEFDLIAKNHLDLYTSIAGNNSNNNILTTNTSNNNNNNINIINNNNNNTSNKNNNDTMMDDDSKLNLIPHMKTMAHKTDGPKSSRNSEHNRVQKLFQVIQFVVIYLHT